MKLFGTRGKHCRTHPIFKVRKKRSGIHRMIAGLCVAYVMSVAAILMVSESPASATTNETTIEYASPSKLSYTTSNLSYLQQPRMRTTLEYAESMKNTESAVNTLATSLVSYSPMQTEIESSEPEETNESTQTTDTTTETTTEEVLTEENIVEPTPEPEPIPELEPEPVDYYHNGFNSSSSVLTTSNLSADQIEGMLSDYPGLDGLGSVIYQIEQENGVNAYYTLAVASLESGYGKSNLAQTKNNLFGMINCTFQSKTSCVEYFGELMNKYESRLGSENMTPAGINPTYCTSDTWAGKVTTLMNQWVNLANEMY